MSLAMLVKTNVLLCGNRAWLGARGGNAALTAVSLPLYSQGSSKGKKIHRLENRSLRCKTHAAILESLPGISKCRGRLEGSGFTLASF